MPFSTGCSTPLSNFESGQNYKEVQDPAVIVSFPIINRPEEKGVSMVAWTTTPWTLPSNLALCVNPTEEYVKIMGMQCLHFSIFAMEYFYKEIQNKFKDIYLDLGSHPKDKHLIDS